MKKFLTKKYLIPAILIVGCAGILITALILMRQPQNEFTATGSESLSSPTDWSEPDVPIVIADDGPGPAPGIEADSMSPDDETDIELTVLPDSKQEEPPPPTISGDATDPNSPPEYTPEQTNPSNNAGPQPGEQNGNGQVWDPVFGWITPAPANGAPVDNGGDPDKQVGNM